MSFNFDKLLKEAQEPVGFSALNALVSAARGGGKSSLVGTFGVPTLHLCFDSESHGIKSSKALGGVIVGVIIDRDESGNLLSPDDSIKNLKALLSDPQVPLKFGAVAIDSLGALDLIINKSTPVIQATKYDKFQCVEDMFTEITKLLNTLNNQGVHTIATMPCDADINKSTQEDIIVTPNLRGFGVTNRVIGMFADVFIVNPVTISNEDKTEVIKKHVIQTNGIFQKAGKTMTGSAKALSFNCRLAGLPLSSMPEDGILPASLKKLIEYKKNALNEIKEKVKNRVKEEKK